MLVDTDENGNQSNARLSLTTVDVQGPMIQFILSTGQVTQQDIINIFRQFVDRDVPLSMVGSSAEGGDAKLQGADIDTHVIAIYLNLILKNGPADDDIRGDRVIYPMASTFCRW